MHFASGSCFPAEHSPWAVAAAAAVVWGRSSPCWGQSSEVTLRQTGCSNSRPFEFLCSVWVVKRWFHCF